MHLPLPADCSLTLIDNVVAERQNGVNAAFFNGIAVEWRARVQAYLDASGSPALVPRWPLIEPQKGSLLNLYGAPAEDSAHGIVLANLRAHQLTLCPSCGEAGRPNTLDHYLPKTLYPHFCITPHNLFPMCDACQGEKGTSTGDAVTPRFFLHPYYDVFVAQQVLSLTIMPPFNAPTFDLAVADGLTPDQTTLVKTHIRELAIVQRFGHFFKGEQPRLMRLVNDIRLTGQNVALSLGLFKMRAERPCRNSWEHVFYSAVLSNPALMDYLENGPLPIFP